MKVLFYDLVKAVSVSSSSASVTLLYVGCLLFISSYTHKCLSLLVLLLTLLLLIISV